MKRRLGTASICAVVLLSILTAARAATITWDGSEANDNWSTAANWSSALGNPTSDTVFFNTTDSGNKSVVDADWIIGPLWYRQIIHTTDLNGNSLQVNGEVNVAVGSAAAHSATGTWVNGTVTIGSVATPTRWDIASNSANVVITGALILADVTVTANVSFLNIGYARRTTGGCTAYGRLTVSNGVDLMIGSAASPVEVNLGWANYNRDDQRATGSLEATNGTVEIHAADIYVGRRPNSQPGSTSGTIHWDQTTAIDANNIYVPYGSGIGQILAPPSGTLAIGSDVDPVTNLCVAVNHVGTSYSATGALDAAEATVAIYAKYLRVGCGRGEGSVKLGPGTVRAEVVTNNNSAANSSALLVTSNTILQVDTAFTNGSAGTVTNIIAGTSSGLVISNSASAAFGIHASATGDKGLNVVFWSAPTGVSPTNAAGATGIFCGFKWAGNHTNDLAAMQSDGRLSWDDTTYLSAPFNGVMTNFYDSASDATYIGCYVTAPVSEWRWDGGGSDDNWSTAGNWDGDAAPPNPTALDVVFGGVDSGKTNIVNANRAIGNLIYTNITHTTDLNGGSALQVNSNATVAAGAAAESAFVTWTNGGSVTLGSAGSGGALVVGEHTLDAAGNTVTGSLAVANVAVTANVSRLSVGRKTTGAGTASGALTLGASSRLVVSSGAVFDVGRNDANNSGAAGGGALTAAGGALEAKLDQLNVGYNAAAGGAATGTVDFTGLSSLALTSATIRVGVGANAAGLLLCSGTVVRVTESLAIGSGGTVTNRITSPYSGFFITNSLAAGLSIDSGATIASGHGLDIVFLTRPSGMTTATVATAEGIYYGFKWAGDHTNDIKALLGSDEINGTLNGDVLRWDDSALPAPFSGAVQILYDAATDATYIGCYIRSSYVAPSVWGGAGTDDKWSTGGNWTNGAAPENPTPADIIFGGLDSGNASVVDANWTIGSLIYSNVAHATGLNGGSRLLVASNVNVGVGAEGASAVITWNNGGAVTVGAEATPTEFDVGAHTVAATAGNAVTGTLALSSVTVTANVSRLSVGRKTAGAGAAEGELTLGSGAVLALRAASRLDVGRNDANDANAAAQGTLTAAGGALRADLSEFSVGYNAVASGAATGVADLRGIGSLALTSATVRVGVGANAAGLLLSSGTVARVTDSLAIGSGGTVTNWVNAASAGFEITNSLAAGLDINSGATIASGHGLDLVFVAAPGGAVPTTAASATNIFYAFKWAGNHTNDLKNLLGTDKTNGTLDNDVLRWDDTNYLTAPFSGAMSIFYDPASGPGLNTDATYIGCYIGAVPAAFNWTGAGGNDNWTTAANWAPGIAPLNPTTSEIIFGGLDSGNASVMNANWTIGALTYTNIIHTTDLGGNALQVSSNVSVAVGNLATHTATATWTNGTVTIGTPGSLRTLTIGENSAAVKLSGTVIVANATVTGYVSQVSIGKAGGNQEAYGTLSIRDGAQVKLGDAGSPAAIDIGYGGAVGGASAEGIGTLNVLGCTLSLYATNLSVGRATVLNTRGTGTVTMSSGGVLVLGSAGAPTVFDVGRNIYEGNSGYGSGTVTASDGGSLAAHLAEWNIGYRTAASGTATASGTVDLQALSSLAVTSAIVRVGVGRYATGRAYFGPGTIRTGVATNNDSATSATRFSRWTRRSPTAARAR